MHEGARQAREFGAGTLPGSPVYLVFPSPPISASYFMSLLQSLPASFRLHQVGATLLILALPACAISLPINSPPGAEGPDPKRNARLSLPGLDEEDWRRAHGILGLALEPSGNGLRVRWDNPASGRKGSIAPTALPVVREGRICRAFLATVDEARRTVQVRGTACQNVGDDWEVTELAR